MISALIIGAGDRGQVYANYQFSCKDFKVVGVADPIEFKRNYIQKLYDLSPENSVDDWYEILNRDKFADVVIISTPDNLHVQPTLLALHQGYDVLLEKPISNNIDDIVSIIDASEKSGNIVQICHELRYSDFYSTIKRIIENDDIGQIVNVSMQENVSYYHYAHSFIRGNWSSRSKSSPMILAKCSHDMDLLYWFVNSLPEKVSSFGGLDHFSRDISNLPDRCTDGCIEQDTCLYYAPRLYEEIIPFLHILSKSDNVIERKIAKMVLKHPSKKKFPPFNQVNEYSGWPVSVITDDITIKGKRKALETGPYGLCVYKLSDHDVVDHQVVSIQFKNKVTATLTMHGHSSEEGRYIRIDGTKGTIVGDFKTSKHLLKVIDSLTNKKTVVINKYSGGGHGGADHKILADFINSVMRKKSGDIIDVPTSVSESYVSHIMAIASDKSRLEGKIIEIGNYFEKNF